MRFQNQKLQTLLCQKMTLKCLKFSINVYEQFQVIRECSHDTPACRISGVSPTWIGGRMNGWMDGWTDEWVTSVRGQKNHVFLGVSRKLLNIFPCCFQPLRIFFLDTFCETMVFFFA